MLNKYEYSRSDRIHEENKREIREAIIGGFVLIGIFAVIVCLMSIL